MNFFGFSGDGQNYNSDESVVTNSQMNLLQANTDNNTTTLGSTTIDDLVTSDPTNDTTNDTAPTRLRRPSNIRIEILTTDDSARPPSRTGSVSGGSIAHSRTGSILSPDIHSIIKMGEIFSPFGLPPSPRPDFVGLSPKRDFDSIHGGDSPRRVRSPVHSPLSDVLAVDGFGTDDVGSNEVEAPRVSLLFATADRVDFWLMSFAVLSNAIYGGMLPAIQLVYGRVFDVFADFSESRLSFDEALSALTQLLVLMASIFAVSTIFGVSGLYLWKVTSFRLYNRILTGAVRSVMQKPVAFFDANFCEVDNESDEPSDVRALLSESLVILTGLRDPLSGLVGQIFAAVVCLILGLVLQWKLALVAFGSLPVLIAIILGLQSLVSPRVRKLRSLNAQHYEFVHEVFSMIQTVICCNGQQHEIRNHDAHVDARFRVTKSLHRVWGMFVGVNQTLIFSLFALIYWFGGILISSGEASPGQVLSVFLLAVLALNSVSAFTKEIPKLSEALQSCRKLNDIITSQGKQEVQKGNLKRMPATISGSIEFRNVWFTFPGKSGSPALSGVSVKLQKGGLYGLVGPSGSGKSTLIQLLAKFYPATSGSILVDGVDIKKLDDVSLRSHMTVVAQESFLFKKTVAENLSVGSVGCSMDEMKAACKLADIHDKIIMLKSGYDTIISSDGDLFSGGERQKLMMARAFLRKSQIVLLDEATSQIDVESESKIMQNLRVALPDSTIVVVAHRLYTVRDANRIFFVDKGKIVQQGTHHELFRVVGGFYWSQLFSRTSPKDIAAEKGKSPAKSLDGWRVSVDLVRDSRLDSVAASQPPSTKVSPFFFGNVVYKHGLRGISLIGAVALISALVGLTVPLYSYVFAQTLSAYVTDDPQLLLEENRINAFFFLALAVGKGLLYTLQFMFSGSLAAMIIRKLQTDLFSSVIERGYSWFESFDHSPDAISMRIVSDMTHVAKVYTSAIPGVFESISILLLSLVLAFSTSWQLALVLLACLPVLLGATRLNLYLSRKFQKRLLTRYEKGAVLISEYLGAFRTVLAFNLKDEVLKEFSDVIWEDVTLIDGLSAGYSLTSTLSFTLVLLCEIVAFRYGLSLLASGAYDYSELTLVFAAVVFSSVSLQTSGAVLSEFGKVGAVASRATSMMHGAKREATSRPIDYTEEAVERGKIKFDKVYFSYPSQPNINILSGLTFSIRKGERVALCGPSGEGKSTILSLIEGLYRPTAGSILIGDRRISKLDIKTLRASIGWISQQPTLFDRTVEDNIRYGNWFSLTDEENDARLSESLKISNLHETELPREDFKVGKNGRLISGGQRQRVCLARIVYRKPRIYFLDEHTSAVDNLNEDSIMESMDSLLSESVCLVVTHKISVLKRMDRILFIKDGVVSESGSHESLMSKNGMYAAFISQRS